MTDIRRLIVVGGGVAGLAGARAARLEADRFGIQLETVVLEAGSRLGGKVWTERTDDGGLLEWGPDVLVASRPRGRDLLEELGLLEEAVAPATGRAYLLLKGRLRPLPPATVMGIPKGGAALRAAVRAGILSPWGVVRAALEPLVPRLTSRRQRLDRLVRNRLGPQVFSRLVEPMVAGVFGTEGGSVGVEAVLPGGPRTRSLMLAARRRPPVSFLGLRGGMGRLVDRLAEALPEADVRLGVRVGSVESGGPGFVVRTDAGAVDAHAVLVAVPAPTAADLLREVAPGAAAAASRVRYGSSAVIHLRYPAGAVGRPLDAAGYLVAPGDRGAVTACSWVTSKWPHLAGPGPHLRAVAIRPATDLADDDLLGRVVEEVGRTMEVTADPTDVRLRRWPQALPRYDEWHPEHVRAIRAALPEGVGVAGASYEGIGIPDCARSGEEAAARLLASR